MFLDTGGDREDVWVEHDFLLAEAEVPKAMADAFRSGNLGVMDYYNMRNIQADTSMRDAIGDDVKPEVPRNEDEN